MSEPLLADAALVFRSEHRWGMLRTMITHVVLFKLKDRSEAAVEVTRQVLLAMRGRIPELIDIEVGADQLHTERSFDLALTTHHESWSALDAYQVHPVHKEVGVHMKQVVERSVAVDYES